MIEYIIETEDSKDHWPYFDVKNHNVLDIGCGRWSTKDFNELSPIYFRHNGANKIVGVDSNINDINFYKEKTNDDDTYTFINLRIDNDVQIKQMLTEHSITAIKCDIEGDERVLLTLTKEDLSNVSEFALEFHTHELKDLFIKKIEEWGFTINVTASFARTPDKIGVLFCSKKERKT